MSQKGFSLTELSISLVLIAIIVGGIVTSTSVMESAKLKVITKEAREYQAAIDRFKEKFKYYPGDFPSGGKYWGYDCNGATTGTDLCSGEGDFKIDDGTNDALTGTSETILAWRHLQAAGLISGSFTGLESSSSNCSGADNCTTSGVNVPPSKWGVNTGFYLISGTSELGLFFGKDQANTWNSGSTLKAGDSKSIDVKIDDGNAVTGFFRSSSIMGTGTTLTNSGTCLTANAYNLSNANADCGAVFVLDGQL
jgi:prepilin-type N-terminal cleavage/methylation domain-containing protein